MGISFNFHCKAVGDKVRKTYYTPRLFSIMSVFVLKMFLKEDRLYTEK